MRKVNENKRLSTFQPVRLSDSERAALEYLAEQNERSRSAEMRMALRAWFAQNGIDARKFDD